MQKVIRMWSSLPNKVIEAGELNKFKGKEGIHLQPCNTTGQSTKKINLTGHRKQRKKYGTRGALPSPSVGQILTWFIYLPLGQMILILLCKVY